MRANALQTATRVLNLLGVHQGTTLLVDGAAGGVGSLVVQLAVARGARVIGTASAQNQSFLRDLGAVATTYGPGLPERVAELAPGGVDAALDVAGAGSLSDLVAATGDPGWVVTIADFSAGEHGVCACRTPVPVTRTDDPGWLKPRIWPAPADSRSRSGPHSRSNAQPRPTSSPRQDTGAARSFCR